MENTAAIAPLISAVRIVVADLIPRLQEIPDSHPWPHPLNPWFRTQERRLQSFTELPWDGPTNDYVNPHTLAAAGLYNIGFRDIVQCFHCGGCIGNWMVNNLKPWDAHAGWHPQCLFINTNQINESTASNYHKVLHNNPGHFVSRKYFPVGYRSIYDALNAPTK